MILSSVLRHPVIALCNVLGIAVGVGAFLAMHSANRSATGAFMATIDMVAGRAHVEMRGGSGGFDEMIWSDARHWQGAAEATAVVEGHTTLPDRPGETLQLIGVDLFTTAPFQTASILPEVWGRIDWELFLGSPNRILLQQPLAAEFGLETGDTLIVEAASGRAELVVAGVLPQEALEGAARGTGLRRVALMDIGWAQQVLGMEGRLSAIQFMLDEEGGVEKFIARHTAALPDGLRLAPPETRSQHVRQMARGYQLNLGALSMVSMFVGAFLIYNTIAASTVRRRREIGILRSLGATRGQVARVFLGEALVLGIPGVILGLLLGARLAGAMVGDVARTLGSRYLTLSVDPGGIEPWSLFLAAGYGTAAVLAGAWWPARQAARLDPVAALHPPTSTHLPKPGGLSLFWLAAFGIITGGAAWLALQAHMPMLSFVACFACLCAFAVLTPIAARGMLGMASPLYRDGSVPVSLGSEAFARSFHRTGVTMAALMTAVAMLTGVVTMVSSFRHAVAAWVDASLDGDLFITPAANETLGIHAFLPDEVLAEMKNHSAVLSLQEYREEEVWIEDVGPVMLTAIPAERAAMFSLLPGHAPNALDQFAAGEALLAGESLRARRPLDGTVSLPTPTGMVPLSIAGAFTDYSDDRGRLYIHSETFARLWDDARIQSATLHLSPEANASALVAQWRNNWADMGTFVFHTPGSLRSAILGIFDQTFAVTNVLRVIALFVAIAGVVLALLALVAERQREISLLRALGASQRQVIASHLVQAAWIGLASSLVGIVCGLALAWILVGVVNPAWFGWTIPLLPDWPALVWIPVWITAAAAAAGTYPAWKAGRAPAAGGLRFE